MIKFFCRYAYAVFSLALVLLLSGCAGLKPEINIPKSPPPAPALKRSPVRVALVLGAGGARGYAHLGALQVLQSAGVPIDLVVGASAGSFVGALYADTGSATMAYQHMMAATFWDLADVSNVPSLSGVIKGYHFERFLLKHMRSRTFKDLKKTLLVVTTDLLTGNPYLIRSGPIAPAVLASSAIPGAVQPVRLYGHVLVDGGVCLPVPVLVARRYHPKIIIAVNISTQLTPVIPNVAVNIFARANGIIWKHLTQFSLRGANIIIRPKVGQVNTFNISQKQAMYEAGVRAARAQLPKILRLMDKKHINR